MDLFISWSGDIGKSIATIFRGWLPKVLQSLRPWMSEVDIDKGAKWDSQISSQLAKSKFGLICLTPQNLDSPAIHFEAGALSKYVEEARLWTLLFEIGYSDIKWPFSQFQHTKAEKSDVHKLLQSMNSALGDSKLSDKDFDDVFETWWPKLEDSLGNVSRSTEPIPQRSERQILEELLELARASNQHSTTEHKLRLSELESHSKTNIHLRDIFVAEKDNAWIDGALHDLKCPVCGDTYQHVGSPKVIDGEDGYKAGWDGRGDLVVVPIAGECSHEWEICFGFHKGNTAAFARFTKVEMTPPGKSSPTSIPF